MSPSNYISIVIMELDCLKYNEKMLADNAVCQHPGDYCKYRTSCMIQFMSSENKINNKPTRKSDKPSQKEKNDSEK